MCDNQYPPQPSPIREGRNAASPFTLHFSLKQRAAFTLAEVLITLGVIGVVAAMTIPSLIAHYQKKVLVNKIKKTYATLNEGIRQIMVNEGCTDMVCAGFMEDVRHPIFNESNRNKIINTFKLFNVETPTSNNDNSKYDYMTFTVSGMKWSSFSTILTNPDNKFAFIGTFPDGTVLFGYRISYTAGNGDTTYDLLFMFDVNGPQKPNVIGRDIQAVILLKSGLVVPPFSQAHNRELGDNDHISIDRERYLEACKNGEPVCLNLIINDGWEMNY